MAPRPQIRPDVRYETLEPTPVECQACGAQVLARKASWEQTSLQWPTAATQACLERRGSTRRPGTNGGVFLGCSAMRDSLREAAVRGDLEVVSADEMPVNLEADAVPDHAEFDPRHDHTPHQEVNP